MLVLINTEPKMTTYDEVAKKAIRKWRENNRDRVNQYGRELYAKNIQNDDYKTKHNLMCLEANRRYRLKKQNERGEDYTPKKRGRPPRATS